MHFAALFAGLLAVLFTGPAGAAPAPSAAAGAQELTRVASEPPPLAGEAPELVRFHAARLADLAWVPSDDVAAPSFAGTSWNDPRKWAVLLPYAVVDGARAAYVGAPPVRDWTLDRDKLGQAYLGLELTGSGPWIGRGRVYLPDESATRLVAHEFTFDVPARVDLRAAGEPSAGFLEARRRHYAARYEAGLPGGAWWRHGVGAGQRPDAPPSAGPPSADASRSYALFTGGRAVSENLRLEDLVSAESRQVESVAIAELGGIRAPELDWSALPAAEGDALDVLAASIPADHHAVFLPTFGALVELVDELRANGTPILDALEPRAEDARTQARYERQLCLELDALARAFGPKLVRSVAVTGGDPYLRTGSDVALLFDCAEPAAFEAFLRDRIAKRAREMGTELVTRELAGDSGAAATLAGAASPDRALSAWLYRDGDVVVVANSVPLAERIVRARASEESLATLAEYRWFRDRYARGADGELAFVVVPDGAIRRWCGPEWRIGASRRVRALAMLGEAEAARAAQRFGVESATGLVLEGSVPRFGSLHTDGPRVRSSEYGTVDFATPIAELDIRHVTPAERQGYVEWRIGYDRLWSQAFDPIGARIARSGARLELDLSVRPIALQTEYRELLDVAGKARIAPGEGTAQPDAIAHAILALDHEASLIRELEGWVSFLVTLGDRPLSWVGDHVEVWLDRDDDLLAAIDGAEDADEFLEEHAFEVPLGVSLHIRDPLRLSAFLGSLKGLLEGSAPGVMSWGPRELVDARGEARTYVAIEPVSGAGWQETPSLYYCVVPGRLVVSLREDVIVRFLGRAASQGGGAERVGAENGGAKEGAEAARSALANAWLGESFAVRFEAGIKDVLSRGLVERTLHEALRRRAFGALPILNEWHRLAPDRDPVEVQLELFGSTVRCPGGGSFVWNAEHGTMESTVFGCPAAPREGDALPPALDEAVGLDLGLTFEEVGEGLNGLRARASLERAPR